MVDDEELPWYEPAPTLQSWSGDIQVSAPWFTFPIGMVRFNDDARTISIDKEFGSCFFISGEVFLTAWHVVSDALRDKLPLHVCLLYGEGETPAHLAFEPVRRVERVIAPDGRETDIAMGLLRKLGPGKEVARLALSSRAVAPGDYVVAYGYGDSQWHEFQNAAKEREIAVNFVPRFCRGTVKERASEGRGFCKWPIYVHDAEIRGGNSGGPLIDLLSKAVCGINSTGMQDVDDSTAADLGAALDWPIPFAQGQTLRQLAAKGYVDLRE